MIKHLTIAYPLFLHNDKRLPMSENVFAVGLARVNAFQDKGEILLLVNINKRCT